MNRTAPMLPEDDVRETPPELFAERSKKWGGFTLDAAATRSNALCNRFYTENGGYARGRGELLSWNGFNGLTGPWPEGSRVWCNPPFSAIPAWVARCWSGCLEGVELIDFLIPATRTEQAFWQKLVEPFRDGRGTLVPGYSLSTDFLASRQHFLKNGQPILNEKTGKRSSPKFGVVMLTWRRDQ